MLENLNSGKWCNVGKEFPILLLSNAYTVLCPLTKECTITKLVKRVETATITALPLHCDVHRTGFLILFTLPLPQNQILTVSCP
jgi:hypothetical protein